MLFIIAPGGHITLVHHVFYGQVDGGRGRTVHQQPRLQHGCTAARCHHAVESGGHRRAPEQAGSSGGRTPAGPDQVQWEACGRLPVLIFALLVFVLHLVRVFVRCVLVVVCLVCLLTVIRPRTPPSMSMLVSCIFVPGALTHTHTQR